MENITIHPHKGYLNTTFSIFLQNYKGKELFIKRVSSFSKEDVSLEVFPTCYDITDDSSSIKYTPSSPGKYVVGISGDKKHNVTFIVEDAIRFGGSTHKTSFISEKTPWCIVVMKDRTYFYNRETKEQYVESISPDKIELVNGDVVLLANSNDEEKTLYSLLLKKPLLHFDNDILLTSDTLILSEEKENKTSFLTIYKYQNLFFEELYFIFCNSYSISNNTIYFSREKDIYSLTLDSFQESEIDFVNDKYEFISFTNARYAVLKSNYDTKVTLNIFDLQEKKIISTLSTSSICTDIEGYSYDNEIINSKIAKLVSLHSQLELERYANVEYKTLSIKHIYIQNHNVYYHVEEECYNGKLRNQVSCRLINGSQTFEVHIQRWANIEATKDAIYIHDNEWVKILHNESIVWETTDKMYVSNSGLRLFAFTKGELTTIYSFDVETGERNVLITVLSANNNTSFYWDWFKEHNVIIEQHGYNHDTIIHPKEGAMKLLQPKTGRVVQHNLINCVCIGGKIYAKGNVFLWNDKKQLPENVKVLSENCVFALSIEGTHIYMHDILANKVEEILSDIFDSSRYEKVLLSDDGRSIIYQKGDELILLDSNTMEKTSFPNLSFVRHYNGYRPLFAIDNYRQPRIINPLTRQFVDNQYLSKYGFVSPNGELYADTALEQYVKYYHILKKQYISRDEYETLKNKYEYSWNCDEEAIENNRRVFIATNRDTLKKNGHTDENLNSKIKASDFLSLFIEKRGFAVIRRCSDNMIVEEIPLGPELWFLNYVAFSFDSRFVAIGGRYHDNTIYQNRNVGGLILIYDLLSKKIIVNKTSTLAIWTVAFSVDGMWAAYSSTPITYIGTSEEEDTKEVSHRSFLTFSPDGKYMALSQQGYKRHEAGSDNWGHQPSTNVYVCSSGDPNKNIIPVITDLADGGLESIYKSKTVTSCSFSLDNRKLMMVGNDGVVVIRNLHLNE